MRLSRTAAIVLRQLYLIRGSISRVLPLFIWVGIDMVLWGFITKFLSSITASPYNFVAAMLGAVLMWDFFARVMQGVTMAFFEDVWSRNFLNFFASPLLISGTSAVRGDKHHEQLDRTGRNADSHQYLLWTLILHLWTNVPPFPSSFTSLRNRPRDHWQRCRPTPRSSSRVVYLAHSGDSLALRGRLLSTLELTQVDAVLGHLLPPSYVFEGMRSLIAGQPVSMRSLVFGIGLAILDILLASWFFTRMYKHAVRTGLIARYSAETVS